MYLRMFHVFLLTFAIAVVTVASGPDVSFAQQTKTSKSKTKVTVPPGGCLIADKKAALDNGKTCAAGCKDSWCTVSTCINGSLVGSWIACYDPSGLCVPKC